jgi:hypothetical protein
LERAARPADPSGVYEDLILRRERRRVATRASKSLLVAVVLSVSLGATFLLTRAFDDTPTTTPGLTPDPVPSQTVPPEIEPIPRGAVDLGNGTLLCDLTSVSGRFAEGFATEQTASVGMVLDQDGSCPRATAGSVAIAAIDLDGDDAVDVVSDTLICDGWCAAFAAPDVDGDGTDELLVQNIQFSIVGLRLLEVVESGELALTPVVVAPPGDPGRVGGFEPNVQPQFWIGGDGFGSDALRCEEVPGGRVLISTTAQMVPPDSTDSVWQAHETTFVLRDGVLHVVDVRDFEEPATFGDGAGPSFTGTGGCGANLDPYD